MSCEAEIARLLRESGQRLTPQRLIILSTLQHVRGHMTATEILERVKKTYPYVDISTVYRTMAALKELNLVSETDMGGGEYHYEWAIAEPHHHLICKECGAEISLDHNYLDDLGRRLLKDYRFQAEIDHLAIFGLCQGCEQRKAEAKG